MIKYELMEQEDGSFIIKGQEGNMIWFVEAVFDFEEYGYAEAFCNILNFEANRAYESAEWNLKKAYYDSTGKFFNYK